ncbi:hypothetical protein HDU86_005504 [Geranomyces michiganensis]|nr:hypothetical protein HDU86_005504 [Geranomyces michiganensis]
MLLQCRRLLAIVALASLLLVNGARADDSSGDGENGQLEERDPRILQGAEAIQPRDLWDDLFRRKKVHQRDDEGKEEGGEMQAQGDGPVTSSNILDSEGRLRARDGKDWDADGELPRVEAEQAFFGAEGLQARGESQKVSPPESASPSLNGEDSSSKRSRRGVARDPQEYVRGSASGEKENIEARSPRIMYAANERRDPRLWPAEEEAQEGLGKRDPRIVYAANERREEEEAQEGLGKRDPRIAYAANKRREEEEAQEGLGKRDPRIVYAANKRSEEEEAQEGLGKRDPRIVYAANKRREEEEAQEGLGKRDPRIVYAANKRREEEEAQEGLGKREPRIVYAANERRDPRLWPAEEEAQEGLAKRDPRIVYAQADLEKRDPRLVYSERDLAKSEGGKQRHRRSVSMKQVAPSRDLIKRSPRSGTGEHLLKSDRRTFVASRDGIDIRDESRRPVGPRTILAEKRDPRVSSENDEDGKGFEKRDDTAEVLRPDDIERRDPRLAVERRSGNEKRELPDGDTGAPARRDTILEEPAASAAKPVIAAAGSAAAAGVAAAIAYVFV